MPHITLSMLNAKMTSQIEAVSPSVSLAVCSTTSKLSFALLCFAPFFFFFCCSSLLYSTYIFEVISSTFQKRK